jgi:transposase
MPPQRTPLRDTNSNRRFRGPKLSPYQRGEVVGLRKAGYTPKEIKDELRLLRGVVRRTLELVHTRDNGLTLPRSGTPKKYTNQARRRMLYCLRNHLKLTYEQRWTTTGLKISDSYIRDLALKEGLTHWRAKKRPELTQEVANKRLLWCRCRAH